MAELQYLDEFDAVEVVEVLTYDLFPGTPAFRLNGEAGRERLLSALGQVRWPRYRTLQQKAAALHFFLNRDHPYIDGNKRFAVTAMEVFLFRNRAALMATDDEVRDLALCVADGSLNLADVSRFLEHRVIRYSWTEDQFRRWIWRLPEEDFEAVDQCWSEADAPSRWERVDQGLRALIERWGV